MDKKLKLIPRAVRVGGVAFLLLTALEGHGYAFQPMLNAAIPASNPVSAGAALSAPIAGPLPTPTVDIMARLRQMNEQSEKTRKALEVLQADYTERVKTLDSLAERERLAADFRRRLLARKMADVRQVLRAVSLGCTEAETYLKGMDLYSKQADIANPWSDPELDNFFDTVGDLGSFAGLAGATASSLDENSSSRQTLLLSSLGLFGAGKLAQALFGNGFNGKVKYLQFSREVYLSLKSAREKYEDYHKHIEALDSLASNLSSDAAFNAAFPKDGSGSLDEGRINSALTEDYVENVLDLARDYNGAVEDLTELFKPVVLKEEDPRSFSLLPTDVQLRIKDVEESYGQFKDSFDSRWRWKLEIQPEVLRTLGATIVWQ